MDEVGSAPVKTPPTEALSPYSSDYALNIPRASTFDHVEVVSVGSSPPRILGLKAFLPGVRLSMRN